MDGNQNCIQNGGAGCSELEVLKRIFTLQDKKMDEKFKTLEDGQSKTNDRLLQMMTKMDSNHNESVRMIENYRREMKDEMDKDFVRKENFKTVKAIVYGAAGMVLIAFFTAVIAQIIKST